MSRRGNVTVVSKRRHIEEIRASSVARACDAFLASRGERKWTREEQAKACVLSSQAQRQRRRDKADEIATELEQGWG